MSEDAGLEWARLADYLSGRAAPDERAEVERWLVADPHRQALVTHLAGVWDDAVALPSAGMDGQALERAVLARVATPPSVRPVRRGIGAPAPRTSWRRWAVAGAGLAAMVGLWFAVPSLHEGGRLSGAAAAERAYVTRAGERATVELADGTTVLLAPKTELRFITTRNGTRTATLRGQAYFTVTPDPRRPFVVRTGAVTTRVLGTVFDVQHYATNRSVRVTVATGKVVVEGVRKQVTLTAGLGADVTDSTATPLNTRDVAAMTAWTRGDLVFERAPVPVVLDALERWYGYTFRLTDSSLMTERVTAVLRTSGDFRKAIGALEDVLNVRAELDGRAVTLRPTTSRAAAPAATAPVRTPSTRSSTPLEAGK